MEKSKKKTGGEEAIFFTRYAAANAKSLRLYAP